MLFWQALALLFGLFFPETTTVGYGTVETIREAEAVFCRRETTIRARAAGVFHRSFPEGQRIPRLGVLGSLRTSRGALTVRAGLAGLVTYAVDGLEEEIAPEKALADPAEVFRAGCRIGPAPVADGKVQYGQPLAKLVDDIEQHIVTRLRRRDVLAAEGDQVWIRGGDGWSIPCSVLKTLNDGGTTWLILRTERFPSVWLGRRHGRIVLIQNRRTGCLVPLRYLRQRDGQYGVFVVKHGKSSFTPVELVAKDADHAVIKGVSSGTAIRTR